jgi:hypothetical protein
MHRNNLSNLTVDVYREEVPKMDGEELPLELTEAISKADKRNDTAIRIGGYGLPMLLEIQSCVMRNGTSP